MSGMKRGRYRVAEAKAQVEPSDIEALRLARSQADADRMDAVRARVDAEDRRHLAVKKEDEAALARIDEEIAAARRRIDIAESKFDRLDEEVRRAEYEAEQARRGAIREGAQRALTQARDLMRTEYVASALAVVDVLRRVRELQMIAHQANTELPDGAPALSVIVDPSHDPDATSDHPQAMEWRSVLVHRKTGKRAPADAFSGADYEMREMLVPKSANNSNLIGFKAIADYVNLPGIELGKYFYGAVRWGQAR